MRMSDWSSDVCSSDLALSVALPLRAAPYAGAVVRNWFCNLLPEGAVRDAIAARLRIPERDDFALLAAVGGECAGAVSIRDPDMPPAQLQDEETDRSEEHTSELQSLMRISYAVFCLKKKTTQRTT